MGSNFELNTGDDFIFGIDVSASMQATDTPSGQTRLEFLKEKVIAFAGEASKYDDDGIDVITFGHKLTTFGGITADNAKDIIGKLQPNESATDTAGLIRAAYALHKKNGNEQTVLFIATDGEPSDPAGVKQAIVDITNDVKDEREFNISILTVGNITPALDKYLTDLDDNLKGAKYDILDRKALADVDFMTAFDGALND